MAFLVTRVGLNQAKKHTEIVGKYQAGLRWPYVGTKVCCWAVPPLGLRFSLREKNQVSVGEQWVFCIERFLLNFIQFRLWLSLRGIILTLVGSVSKWVVSCSTGFRVCQFHFCFSFYPPPVYSGWRLSCFINILSLLVGLCINLGMNSPVIVFPHSYCAVKRYFGKVNPISIACKLHYIMTCM